MRRNDGFIDVDEFDLFVSRIRDRREIAAASISVGEFRALAAEKKEELRTEVRRRIPRGRGANPRKRYNNWRDMALHTFSLFSLGESAYRVGNELFLSNVLLEQVGEERHERERPEEPRQRTTRRQVQRSPMVLRIPEVEASEDLLEPPTPSQSNTGTNSELLVGKILAADGWQVVYYSQRRGYGFDLWARKRDQAFLIEVKSFSSQGGTVALTPLEYEAAIQHSANFLLVVVENAKTPTPTIHVVQNPVKSISFTKRALSQYSAGRAAWIVATADILGINRRR